MAWFSSSTALVREFDVGPEEAWQRPAAEASLETSPVNRVRRARSVPDRASLPGGGGGEETVRARSPESVVSSGSGRSGGADGVGDRLTAVRLQLGVAVDLVQASTGCLAGLAASAPAAFLCVTADALEVLRGLCAPLAAVAEWLDVGERDELLAAGVPALQFLHAVVGDPGTGARVAGTFASTIAELVLPFARSGAGVDDGDEPAAGAAAGHSVAEVSLNVLAHSVLVGVCMKAPRAARRQLAMLTTERLAELSAAGCPFAAATWDVVSRYAHADAGALPLTHAPYRTPSWVPSGGADDAAGGEDSLAESVTWVAGVSLITVRARPLGLAEVTMRRPSGCVRWYMQIAVQSRPAWTPARPLEVLVAASAGATAAAGAGAATETRPDAGAEGPDGGARAVAAHAAANAGGGETAVTDPPPGVATVAFYGAAVRDTTALARLPVDAMQCGVSAVSQGAAGCMIDASADFYNSLDCTSGAEPLLPLAGFGALVHTGLELRDVIDQ